MTKEDIKKMFPRSAADSSWVDAAIMKMGNEQRFNGYKNAIYEQLDALKVGQTLRFESWAKPENLELFVKIVWCYITETYGCYSFTNDYQSIKKHFDAPTKQRALQLYKQKYFPKDTGADGAGDENGSTAAETIPAPIQDGVGQKSA